MSSRNWHISFLPQFILQEVDITLPENSAWYDKYKYDIPVFHLNGKFLMKHRVNIQKFEDQLRKLELQSEGNQWRKCSCSDADLKGEKNCVKKTHTHYLALNFLGHMSLKNLSDLCYILYYSPSPAASGATFSVPFICCSCGLVFHWQNKSCSITADKVNSVWGWHGQVWVVGSSTGVVSLRSCCGRFPCVQLSQCQPAPAWTLWPRPRPSEDEEEGENV